MGVKKKTRVLDGQSIVMDVINAPYDGKVAKLNQLNKNGFNALMLVANRKCLFKYLPLILQSMRSVDSIEEVKIFKQGCTFQGGTTLMFAARLGLSCLQPILGEIEKLDIKNKADILKQISTLNRSNALMVAVRYMHLESVQAILNSMKSLESKDKTIILKQCSSRGLDALELALAYCPGAVVPLVKAHLSIGYDDVLYRFNMILKTLSKKRPEDIPELLQAVVQLSCSQQQIIYGTLTPLQYAQQYFQDIGVNTSLRKSLREAVSHAEVRFSLAMLKQKADELDRKIGFNHRYRYLAPACQARQLYNRLNNSYEAFIRGESLDNIGTKEKAPYEGAQLISVWADAIEKAKPVLATHRGIKETVFRLCTLVLTPVMWICNAVQGKAFKFFPYSPETDAMQKVNKVMHALQEAYHFDTLQAENAAPPPYDNLTAPSISK
jgi:hypothetical protein